MINGGCHHKKRLDIMCRLVAIYITPTSDGSLAKEEIGHILLYLNSPSPFFVGIPVLLIYFDLFKPHFLQQNYL